ncbi:nucleotidyltransferase domain-containing protein [Agromyces sp. G08B096]|uniref:Nucleotidyltransferase domain-containing protein n=1 Tax=Agromyces sp. G08B096 TaxID=3156399 RepID=A0AAU7W9B9_9MICO
MSVTDAFNTFQEVVNADITSVREARARRDLFKNAFGAEDDVKEVVASGSLARGTHKDPIHDVDVIVVFDQDAHPDWGTPGDSAADALNYTRERVNTLLGSTNGTYDKAVRLARWRNHAVKCFLDDPDDPNAFTVDAMPALRRDGKLLIPEALSEDWVSCDPEFLIAEVAKRHAAWNKFAGTVRMLKWWAAEQDTKIKSLVMEVLALDFLPTDVNQPAAIKQFFVSACYYIEGGNEVVDPAYLCGPIQPDVDYGELVECLRAARDNAIKAFQAQANNDTGSAIKYWGEVFGDDFPKPPASTANPAPAILPATPRPVKDTPQG